MRKFSSSCFKLGVVLLLVLVFAGINPSFALAATVKVRNFSPTGSVTENTSFRISFSTNMVQKTQVGKSISQSDPNFPFTVTPPVQLEGKWRNSTTFTATLLSPLNPGTSYTATVREGLKDRRGATVTGGPYKFDTGALEIAPVNVQATLTTDNAARLIFTFNMPIDPARFKGFLTVNEGEQQRAFIVQGAMPSKTMQVRVPFYDKNTSARTLDVRVAAGLTGNGDLGLTEDFVTKLTLTPEMKVIGLRGNNSYNEGIQVNFNFDVNAEKAADFITVEPKPDDGFRVTPHPWDDGALIIRGDFKPRNRYVVTMRRGLPARSGLTLKENFTQAVIMPDLEAAIRLPSAGTYLSTVNGGLVPIELTNIRKLKVDLWRLYESNVPHVVHEQGRNDYYSFPRDLSRRVYSQEFDLSLPINERVRRSLAIDDMLHSGKGASDVNGDTRGMFLLTVRDLDGEYWNEQEQVLTLSDIGAVARVWDDGLLFWVNSLSGTNPIKDALIRVYSGTNQILVEGKTDSEGLFVYQRDPSQGAWGTSDGDQPRLAVISSPKTQDFTYVELTRSLLSRETFDTAGRPWLREGYDAMIFAPRDIYRTGENVPFKVIVRNPDVTTPEPFPVLLVIRDPMGRATNRELLQLNAEGSASYTLNLPSNALTGLWTASLTIPGREDRDESFGSMNFHVEDFAPPRIEVKLTSESGPLSWIDSEDTDEMIPEDFTASINSKYLFGAPAAELPFRAEWSASAVDFKPTQDRWKAYSFGDPSRKFTRKFGTIGSAHLSETGNGTVTLNLKSEIENDDWRAATLINVTIRAEVREDSGRWISGTVTRQYWPAPWLLGIAPEIVRENDMLPINQDAKFRVVAIDADENLVAMGGLTATLSKVTWNYNMVEVDGHRRWQCSEEITKLEEKTLTVDESQGFGTVAFKPETWGTYMVRISDEDDIARAVYRFTAVDPAYAARGVGSQILDRVTVSTNQESYKIGETAHVTFNTPFGGLMLVNVEGAKLISRHIVKVDQPDITLDIPVTSEMVPNAWVSAWLIRPVKQSDEDAWGAHRAIGVTRLKTDLSPWKVDVDIDAPDRIEPAKPLSVNLTLKNSGKPVKGEVALALVDDAVLGLTGFKTPDLLNYFYGLKELGSKGYDFYDQLIPIESRTTETLHPSGDMGMGALAGAGSNVQRFKILSLFESTLESDSNGVIRATLDVPEFSGRGRLFAVVNAGNRFGMAERSVQIARNVVTETNLPRFAAPGDTFNAPFSVFNMSEKPLTVKLEISAKGLEVQETEVELDIEPNDSISWSTEVKALDITSSNAAKWEVRTSWTENGEHKEFTQEIDLPVRSPWPIVTRSGSGVFENGKTSIKIPVSEFSGLSAVQASGNRLTLADTPAVDLTRAANYLLNYPYACLEQTISAAWPFMTLLDAISEVDPLLMNDTLVQDKTRDALARIQSMQLYDGSFTMWPGGNSPFNWGSVYAAHFMTELRDAGITVPDEMFKGVMNWIKQFLASMPDYQANPGNSEQLEHDDFTTKAYAVYVLALNGEKPLGWIEFLRENQAQMWPSGKIWLAGAEACIAGRGDALRALGPVGSGSDAKNSRTFESDVRNTAQLLSIWMNVEPQATEAVELAARLTKQGQDGQWYSTQDNAQALMALARYNMYIGNEKSNLKGTVLAENTKLLDFTSGKSASLSLEGQPDNFTLDVNGTGRGYYNWTLTGTPKTQPKPEQRGLEIECTWLDFDGRKVDLSKPLTFGTRLKGILTIKPALPISNVAVSCLLPAGFELDNPRIGGDGDDAIENVNSWSVVSDVRDDRLLLFFNRLESEASYAFSVRAVTMGTFAVPPISATGMYDPSVAFTGATQPALVID